MERCEEQIWFEEAIKSIKVHTFGNESVIFYNGFRLSKKPSDRYTIKDLRFSDDYTPVRPKELKQIRLNGFVKGVDDISCSYTKGRLERYKKKAELLYAKRKRANREMSKDVRLNKKRIRNANKNIDILVDQILLCKAKIDQYNSKYKSN